MRTVVTAVVTLALIATATSFITNTAAASRAEFNTTLLSARTYDIGSVGPGVGDVSIRRWRITDRDGTPQGFAYEVCRWTTRLLRLCTGTYELSTGTIAFEGIVGDASPLALTGGTGEYVGASGQVTRLGRVVKFMFE